MPKYRLFGSLSIPAEVVVEADSEEEAVLKAIEGEFEEINRDESLAIFEGEVDGIWEEK